MQKLIIEQQEYRNRKSAHLVAILLVLVVLSSIARVFMANWLVESSETLHSLDEKIAQQAIENQLLAQDLRKIESLSNIESQALTQGFSKQNKMTFISSQPHVAFKL